MKRSVITINDNLGTIALGFSKAGYDVRAIYVDSSDNMCSTVCADNWGTIVRNDNWEGVCSNDGLDLSKWSQTLVIHMIRTPKIPFIQSRASVPLTLLTFTGIALLTIIPFTGFGAMLGFVALPASYFAYLIPCILLYMCLATSLKKAYVKHFGELL